MANIVMQAPTGTTELHLNGTKYPVAADGTVTLPSTLKQQALSSGCSDQGAMPSVFTTAKRPTAGLVPGEMVFDSTLNKPIWRNAANSGWVDATGTAV